MFFSCFGGVGVRKVRRRLARILRIFVLSAKPAQTRVKKKQDADYRGYYGFLFYPLNQRKPASKKSMTI